MRGCRVTKAVWAVWFSGAVLASSCADGEPTESETAVEIDFASTSVNGVVPELEAPISVEDSIALRDAFDWADTDALQERDPDGYPALYYALVYVQSYLELEQLEKLDIYHNTLPLFPEELERWAGQQGAFLNEGDGEGMFVFTFLTAGAYNYFRKVALEGEPAFPAILFREVPNPDAVHPSGSLDYEWLVDHGFRYTSSTPAVGPDGDEEATAVPESEAAAKSKATGVASQALFLEWAVASIFSREARDVSDDLAGDIDRNIRGKGTVKVELELRNTDPDFGDPEQHGSDTAMVRAWGSNNRSGVRAGQPVYLSQVEVVAQADMGIVRKRTDLWGEATLRLGGRTLYTLCVRADNHAGHVSAGFDSSQVCKFQFTGKEQIRPTKKVVERVRVPISDYRFNILGQFTDSWDYMNRVVGFAPKRARVLVGELANTIGSFNGNRAATFCGSFVSAASIGTQGTIGLGFGLVATALGPFAPFASVFGASAASHDVIFPHAGRTKDGVISAGLSRGVPTHEYGHFAMCSLYYYEKGPFAFGQMWSDVMATLFVGKKQNKGVEVAFLTEAFADYFASQVIGGVNYFRLPGSFIASDGRLFLCPGQSDSCLDYNDDGSGPDFDDDMSGVVTLMHDVFDGTEKAREQAGDTEATSPGAFWDSFGTAPEVRPAAAIRTDAEDESVTISGRGIQNMFHFMPGASLNVTNYYTGLAKAMSDEGVSETDICQVFALHSPTTQCDDVIDASAINEDNVVPGKPFITGAEHGNDDHGQDGHWFEVRWRDVSPLADGFELELLTGEETAADEREAYSREASHRFHALTGDTDYLLRLVTTNGRVRGPAAEHAFVTLPDGVTDVETEALRGGVRLVWHKVRATSYVVRMTAPTGAIREVGTTSTTELVVNGLAAGQTYAFQIVPLNRVGLQGPASPKVFEVPLQPRALYVSSTRGSDGFIEAGSAARPFGTLTAALAASDGIDALYLERGEYEEVGPVVLGTDLSIEGGFDVDGDVWVRGQELSSIAIQGSKPVASCRGDYFNLTNKSGRASVEIAGNSRVLLRQIALQATPGGDQMASCGVALHAGAGAQVTLEDSRVAVDEVPAQGGCLIGIQGKGTGGGVLVRTFD